MNGGVTELKELTTLVNCTQKLELALQDDRDIVHFLNGKGLISDDVHSDVIEPTSMLSRRAKAGLVVDAIKSSVKRNCRNYYILTNYLHQDRRKYSDIISILDEEFQRVSSIQANSFRYQPLQDSYAGNGIPHQPLHHDGMRSSSSSSTNGQKEIAFSKDFDPVKMSKWLHTKGLPEDDCAKVQKDNITGRAFLLYSKDDWKELAISRSGIFTLMTLQEEVKAQLADSAHHPVPTEPSQQPPSTSIPKEPPPQLQDHPSQDSSASERVDIDGETKTLDNPSQNLSAQGRDDIDGGTGTPYYTEEEEQSLREENSPAMTPQSGTPERAGLEKFSEEVKIILHTVNDHEYNAATTYMEAPPGGLFTKAVIFPRKGSVVGMFAGKKTALIQTEQGNKARKDIENALETFSKATYILGIGVCYSLNDSKHQFGDVLVSKLISDYNTPRLGTIFENRGETKEVHESLLCIFCKNLDEFNKKSLVSESPKERYSKVYSGLLICSPQLIADEEIREKIKESVPTAIGGEMEGGELSTFIGKKEVSGIIIIKGVADFGDDRKKEGKKWQFTSAMAAFKYAHLKLSSIPELF